MSFVSATRDYFEILNNISTSVGTDFTVYKFVFETLVYVLKTIQASLIYFITFQWLHDFTLLPILIPQATNSIFKEIFFFETPSKIFFKFLEIPTIDLNPFLLGLFNSIFLTLPFSITHIISIRRLFIQGIPAGVFSIGGYVCGQILFLMAVLFGLRPVLIPWLTTEPLTYLIGVVIIFRTVYQMTQENLSELTGWKNVSYRNFFLTSFILSWCEQSSIFQYLGNISISPKSTILEGFANDTLFSSYFTHFCYIFGIFVGSILFNFLWGFFFLEIKKWCIRYTPLFLSSFIQTINKVSFILALSLSLSTLPFYGFDYLITNPLGFISQDRVFKNTILDQYNVKDSLELLGASSNLQSLDIDISNFDRGRYIIFPESPQPLSFEDLNYQGEAEWTTRFDKLSGITDSRAGFFTLSKLFKKQNKVTTPSLANIDQTPITKTNQLIQSNSGSSSNFEDTTTIGGRFADWYGLKTENADDLSFEKTFKDFYNSSFPTDFLRSESLVQKDIEEKLKSKYYSNPLYKNILKLDIDLFLKRQPQKFLLSGDNEVDLYNKRLMLLSYYDSLREYSKLPYSQTFENFFDGSKSFANKVYNQQFKGTLRSVRRLFSLTFSTSIDKNSQSSILKFDQPLYQLSLKDNFTSYHEELPEFDLTKDTKLKRKSLPFIREFLIKPIYAGWDENSRKFVITNKLLARSLAGYKVNLPLDKQNKFLVDKTKLLAKTQKIKFTIWPLSIEKLFESQTQSLVSYVTLYEAKFDPKNQNEEPFELFSTLPSNWQSFQRQTSPTKSLTDIFDYLAPQRGGFIWPGSKTLFLKFYK